LPTYSYSGKFTEKRADNIKISEVFFLQLLFKERARILLFMTLETILETSKEKSEDKNSAWYKHIVDSTAFLSVVTPLYAAMHNMIGISDEHSFSNRLLTIGLTYAGIGKIYASGLRFSRKLCRVHKEKSELAYGAHDTIYSMAFNAIIAPTLLYLIGEHDVNHIKEATAIQILLAMPTGWVTGYAMDAAKELMNIEKTSRWLPDCIRQGSATLKKNVAYTALITSLITTAGIYALPNYQDKEGNISKTEIHYSEKLSSHSSSTK
jgi:hypothetical protein